MSSDVVRDVSHYFNYSLTAYMETIFELCIWWDVCLTLSYVYKASLLSKVIIVQDKRKLFFAKELLVVFFFIFFIFFENVKIVLFYTTIRWWKVPDQWWSQTRAFGLSWSDTSRSWRAGGQQAAVWASLHLKTKKTLHVRAPLYLIWFNLMHSVEINCAECFPKTMYRCLNKDIFCRLNF